ncbi:MAG TPA: hypothetical protein VLL52_07750 [Anaerolineae bacterium]|nr:hypothetical protein [Anaerolineae bacterium]
MPKQNRVTPNGDIIAHPAHGSLMGNRGVIHNNDNQISKIYSSKAWLICQLHYKNKTIPVMAPGCHTQLFFLDEATALAAGHRPCFICQRSRAKQYQAAWQRAHQTATLPTAPQIDATLHQERLTYSSNRRDNSKKTYQDTLHQLPAGTIISFHNQPHLYWQQQLYPWTITGYQPPIHPDTTTTVTVLTPSSTVALFHHGFIPHTHPSI